MSFISAILVPLDGSDIAARSLERAAWLASRLGARLHALYSGSPLPAEQAHARLGVPERYRDLIELHQTTGEPTADILAAVEQYRIGLIVMTARGQSATDLTNSSVELLGHVARGAIEQSPVPVLLSPRTHEEIVPWRAALVPVSGEVETDQSLMFALKLANALDLAVTIAHIVQDDRAGERFRYMDASHHEYPQILNEIIERACPLSGPAERRRIRDFHVTRGDVARGLLEVIEQQHLDVAIAGWHRFLGAGHAQVLKTLLQQLRCPALLVPPRPKQTCRLKVADAFA